MAAVWRMHPKEKSFGSKMAAVECVAESMVIGQTDGPTDGGFDGRSSSDAAQATGSGIELGEGGSAIFDSCIVALLRDDGQLRKLHEAFVQIDVYQQQYEAFAKVIKGSRVVCSINLNNNIEMARIRLRSLALSVEDETYFIRFQTSKDVQSFLETIKLVQSKRAKSTFTQRTDPSSAEQYFQFYGYLSQQQNMMQDYVRTSTYQRAMLENAVDFQDKVVLDVGAGSGILSFFAVQAGAKRVYAVEASSMATHCENLVQANMMLEQIIVVAGKIEEVNIPEMVDIIISEPMGYMLFNERMLETYLHAKKWLKPGGKMFPSQGDLHITPFTDDSLYLEQFSKANFWYQPSFHGVDLTVLRDNAVEEYFKQPIVDTFDVRICLAKTHKYTVNFESASETDLHDINIPISFTLQQSGTVHGLAFWFDVAFNGSQSTVWLSTAPTQPLTHWYQVRCLLRVPIFVRLGQTLVGTVHLRSNARQSYDVDIDLHVPGSSISSSNTLDLKNPCFRYTGQPIQPPPGANHTSPTDAYWNQQDATATADQVPTDATNISVVNGDVSQFVQLSPSNVVYNNYLSPVAANLIAGIAGINPGSIPSPAVVGQTAAVQSSNVDISHQTGYMTSHPSVATRTQFPLTNQLMIGDYVVPNNIILPSSAQSGLNILQYKAVGGEI